MSSRAYVYIIYEKTKGIPLENITWSELRKQNIQAKKVYYLTNNIQKSFLITKTIAGEPIKE